MTRSVARVVLLAAVLVLPWTVVAQQTAAQKILEPMVGRWQVEVDLKATPLTQAAKATGTEECEWFAGRHVVCRSEAKGPAGAYSQMRTFSYIPARKDYAVYAVDSLGTALLANGQLTGDTWTFTTSQPAFNIRLTLKIAPGAYTAVAEYAGLDGKYLPLSEVRGTRTK
jgi:hypothetical protein